MKKVDKLIKAKYILTMDKSSKIIEDGVVVISADKILDVGNTGEILEKYQAEEIIDFGNSIVMPGMINTHTHAAMTYFRGMADDLKLDDWLTKHIWPAEGKFVNANFVKDASELACLEMIESGVTTFSDMYFFAGVTAEVVENSGMRAMLGEGAIDFSTPSAVDPDEALRMNDELIVKYKDNKRINILLCAHSIYVCNEETLGKVLKNAEKNNLPIHIHVSETEKENKECLEKYSLSPVAYLDKLGLLNERTILAHSVWMEDGDIEILEKRKVKISHNPISNMKLASGIMPLGEMYGKLTVGLGTDGAASNNTLDIFSDMRSAALIHKVINKDASFLPAQDVVRMATINGAKVLGLEKQIGSLEIGKQADLISVNLNKARLAPIFNPYSHLVYAAESGDVENAMVAGKFLMRDKKVVTMNIKEILQKVNNYSAKIKKYADINR